MQCKFTVGQRVVAIKDHHDKEFLKSQEFTVLDIDNVCGDWVIRIHEDTTPTVTLCRHKAPYFLRGRFYYENYFAPIQEMGEMTFEEALSMFEPKKEKIESKWKKTL